MTTASYPSGWVPKSKEHGKSARWVVNFNNGNVNDYNDNNRACVRACRPSEYHGEVSLKSLFDAWRSARRGKKPSSNQLAFDVDWGGGLLRLQDQLNTCTWEPAKSTCFIAARPKARQIHAPDFSDRVVHHWLIPQMESIWEPGFIFDSYANRMGKGSHAAVRRLQKFVRQVDSGQGGGWYLQLDIHNFFNSIHRQTLWRAIKPKLVKSQVSEQVMYACHALLRRSPLHSGVVHYSTPEEREMVPPHKRLENAAPGCGLPIGNLSSQFFANIYLDRLDQFVKHKLKAKRYLRYVDDFVLVHRDRQVLAAWLSEIEKFIEIELRLKLKPDIKLSPLKDGIDFLGYIVRPTHTFVRRRVVSHARQALSSWEQAHVREGHILAAPEEFSSIRSVVASYHGHMKHANSARLAHCLVNRFWWIPTAIRPRKFDYRLAATQIAIQLPKKKNAN